VAADFPVENRDCQESEAQHHHPERSAVALMRNLGAVDEHSRSSADVHLIAACLILKLPQTETSSHQ
jgi:hypothetical protein